MNSLTLNQKRFLIVWILLNSFALFVNLADIRGAIDNSDTSYNSYGYLIHNGTDRIIYLFTNSSGQNKSDFWPFTSYYSINYPSNSGFPIQHFYGGLFNSYDIPEYIFYMVLGFAIVFVPKLWNDKKPAL